MNRVRSWRIVLPSFLIGGALIGWALPALKAVATSHGGRAGLGVALAINVGLPLLVIALSAVCTRLWTALLGTLLLITGFLWATGELAALHADGLWLWAQELHPIFVVACTTYFVLAAGTVLALRLYRRGHARSIA